MERVLEIINGILRDKEKARKVLFLTAALLIVTGAFAVKNASGAEETRDGDIPLISEETEETESSTIYVDIGGAVNDPKLAELPQGSRVEDAIVAAGGLSDTADITSINRAEFLEDGEKIYIPEKLSEDNDEYMSGGDGSTSGSPEVNTGSGTVTSGKVSINSADSSQLQTLNGIGPVTAQKIIDYRTANGRFRTIEDIKNVSGIGDKTFEKIKDDITI